MEGAAVANPLSPEIQEQMNVALNIAQPAADPNPANPAAAEGAVAEPAQGAAPTEEIVDQEVFITNYLKEKFGYDNEQAALTELQALRELKAKPPVAEHKFTNDEAKKWYEYFTASKEDELRESLNARKQVKDVDGMNDEQKIKLFIKMQNPLFDQELIDYQFGKDYGFNEAAFKDPETGQITDPMAYRFAKVASQQKMQNDIQKANEYFSQYKSKIELPAIQAQSAPIVDESYEGYKASTAKAQEDYNNIIAPALTALTEAQLPFNVNVNDPNNQMQFDVNVVVDKQDFEDARKSALDYSDHLSKTYYDQTGKFLPEKLAKAILLEKNFDKYAQTIARQAVMAERKRVIEKESSGGVIRKDFTNPEAGKTELQIQMERAFAV